MMSMMMMIRNDAFLLSIFCVVLCALLFQAEKRGQKSVCLVCSGLMWFGLARPGTAQQQPEIENVPQFFTQLDFNDTQLFLHTRRR